MSYISAIWSAWMSGKCCVMYKGSMFDSQDIRNNVINALDLTYIHLNDTAAEIEPLSSTIDLDFEAIQESQWVVICIHNVATW